MFIMIDTWQNCTSLVTQLYNNFYYAYRCLPLLAIPLLCLVRLSTMLACMTRLQEFSMHNILLLLLLLLLLLYNKYKR